MNSRLKHNLGDLVRYYNFHNSRTHRTDWDVGVVTAVDEFGEYRVVWTSGGGVGWYTCAELEVICNQ